MQQLLLVISVIIISSEAHTLRSTTESRRVSFFDVIQVIKKYTQQSSIGLRHIGDHEHDPHKTDELTNEIFKLLNVDLSQTNRQNTQNINQNAILEDELINILEGDTNNQNDLDDMFFQTLVQEGIISDNPTIHVDRPPNCRCVPRNQGCVSPTPGILNNPILGEIVDLRIQSKICADPLQVCCSDVQDTKRTGIQQNVLPKGCGKRFPLGIGVRLGFFSEKQSQFGEFPWTVALIRKVNVQGDVVNAFTCGGSLIHPQIVLTTAHCVEFYSSNDLIVRVGEWSFESESEPYPHNDITISQKIIHPNYSRTTLHSNAALLILNNPAPEAPNINTVCLASHADAVEEIKCYSSGWGKDVFNEQGQYQKILKKVILPVVPNDHCTNLLRNTRLGSNFILPAASMCAGGEAIDTCTGDGGSPLVCKKVGKSNTYLQMGIVGWGIGCNTPNVPGVYTSVVEVLPWIQQQVIELFGVDAVHYFTDTL